MFQRAKKPFFIHMQKMTSQIKFRPSSSTRTFKNETENSVVAKSQEESELKNSSLHHLEKGSRIISYDYTNQDESNPDRHGHFIFASPLNLFNRIAYEIENGKKEIPSSLSFSEIKQNTQCVKGLKERGDSEIETFDIDISDLEPTLTLKPRL